MKAILFDLDGVFYQDDQTIPGSSEVVKWAHRQGIPHLFLTNTSSKSRDKLRQKLQRFGIEADINHILTPSLAACHWLKRHKIKGKIALFIPDNCTTGIS